MVNLADTLASPPAPEPSRRDRPTIPNAGDPGTFTFDGRSGVVNTQPLTTRPVSWDAFIRDAGIDPDEVDVVPPVNVRGWDAQVKNPDGSTRIEKLRYYSIKVEARRIGPSIEDLLALVRRQKKPARPAKPATDTGTFVVALGDLQLGKVDGDGVEGTIQRVTSGLDRAADTYKALRKQGRVGPIHLAWLGDCIEGNVSQSGANLPRTTLTMSEQVRLLRKLMMHALRNLAPLTTDLSTVAVPGNHDQTTRHMGKVIRFDDSWDVDSLLAVRDVCAERPDLYGHVRFHTPEPDEMTVTINCGGTIITHAHGHQFTPGKHMAWWSGQAFGSQPAGEADVMLAGHLHHLHIEQSGKRTFVRVPALESRSQWWVHRTGQVGNPGVLTAVVDNHNIGAIDIV